MTDKVAIAHCASYDEELVTAALRQILSPWGGMQHFISPGQRVLIKPNLLFPSPVEKLITTHPSVVAGVIQLVKEAGGISLVGDKPAIGNAARAAKACGIEEVCKRYGARIIELGPYQKIGSKDKYYGMLGTSKAILEAEVIINLPKLKAHDQLLLTLGVKNMFGGVNLTERVRRHFISRHGVDDFARMLMSTYQLKVPTFTIIDGIIAMEGHGPRGGSPKELGLLIGGPNAIAVDRIVAEILCLPWEELPTLKAAQQLELTGWNICQIEVCGALPKIADFKFPQLISIKFPICRTLKIICRKLLTRIIRELKS